jgi:hypothetical protein
MLPHLASTVAHPVLSSQQLVFSVLPTSTLYLVVLVSKVDVCVCVCAWCVCVCVCVCLYVRVRFSGLTLDSIKVPVVAALEEPSIYLSQWGVLPETQVDRYSTSISEACKRHGVHKQVGHSHALSLSLNMCVCIVVEVVVVRV